MMRKRGEVEWIKEKKERKSRKMIMQKGREEGEEKKDDQKEWRRMDS